MFGILMPPGQEEMMEDHYEDINCYSAKHIALQCLPDLLHGMMEVQYLPSKELAMIYFANNEIEPYPTTQEIEAVEFVKCYPDQLELAFNKAFADKLLVAVSALEYMVKKMRHRVLFTKQLKEVVTHKYIDNDLSQYDSKLKALWMEFNIEVNKWESCKRPRTWYYMYEQDPYMDNVAKENVSCKEILSSLVAVRNALHYESNCRSLRILKMLCMHLLMINKSLQIDYGPKAITQHTYRDICEYVLKKNITSWTIWDNKDDLDPAQVVMVRHLSKAARSAAKLDKPTTKFGLQNLFQWFAVETFVTATAVRKSHKKNYGGCEEVAHEPQPTGSYGY